jgi:hypothetical protein
MSWRAELTKRWRARASAITLILALIVLMDEIVKEGYAVDPYDFISPGVTHEKIFIILLLLAILPGWRGRG